jgi:flagellar protein FlgJ
MQATLPSDLQNAQSTIDQIDSLSKHPGLDSIVGSFDQMRPSWTLGSEGKDALARFNQLRGRAFLQAYSTLRGGGSITEVEGNKAEAAMARMDRSQSEPEFRQALQDFRDAVQVGATKLREKAGVSALPTPAAGNSAPADPLGLR